MPLGEASVLPNLVQIGEGAHGETVPILLGFGEVSGVLGVVRARGGCGCSGDV